MANIKNWDDFIEWYQNDRDNLRKLAENDRQENEKKRQEFLKEWPIERLPNLKFEQLAVGYEADNIIFETATPKGKYGHSFLMSTGQAKIRNRIKKIDDIPKVSYSKVTGPYIPIEDKDFKKIAEQLESKIKQFLNNNFDRIDNFFDGYDYSAILIKLVCLYNLENNIFIPDNDIGVKAPNKSKRKFFSPIINNLSDDPYEANHQILKKISEQYGEEFPEFKDSWILNSLLYNSRAWSDDTKESSNSKNPTIVENNKEESEMDKKLNSVNTILYGPPGTGKTYNSVIYAINTIDPEFNIYQDKIYQDYLDKFNELKKEGKIQFTTFHQSYGYEEFIEGIKPETKNNQVFYDVKPGIFKQFCDKANADSDNSYVFIIDEINRGNISKIFGELITLIESSKRKRAKEQMSVILPYSGEEFSVPNNVYILGTMNTADRSIALMDTALRRRFEFIEMLPDTSIVRDNNIKVDEIDIAVMLEIMNKRIEVLYDREHTLGHAFFMELNWEKNRNIVNLGKIFKNKIIPLLQEYFYEDYEKIMAVLGIDKDNENKNKFISKLPNDDQILSQLGIEIEPTYRINTVAFGDKKNYTAIYTEEDNEDSNS